MAAETLIEDEIRPGSASLAAASLRRDVATRLGDSKQKGGVEVGGGWLGGVGGVSPRGCLSPHMPRTRLAMPQ